MFTGPNSSGKSCFNNIVHPKWLGVYVNADEIEKSLGSRGLLLSDFKVELDDAAFIDDFKTIISIIEVCITTGPKTGLILYRIIYSLSLYTTKNSLHLNTSLFFKGLIWMARTYLSVIRFGINFTHRSKIFLNLYHKTLFCFRRRFHVSLKYCS